jgi:class 3 adenylate cyclase
VAQFLFSSRGDKIMGQPVLRDVIGTYHHCVADAVRRFDGLVAKYMGDGVLVYFGFPRAHEDDAERAVRAGLEVVASVGRPGRSAPTSPRSTGRERSRRNPGSCAPRPATRA